MSSRRAAVGILYLFLTRSFYRACLYCISDQHTPVMPSYFIPATKTILFAEAHRRQRGELKTLFDGSLWIQFGVPTYLSFVQLLSSSYRKTSFGCVKLKMHRSRC